MKMFPKNRKSYFKDKLKHLIASLLSFLSFLFIASLLSGDIQAATYYVSPTGNDNNSGTSTSSPFRTIQRAANLAVAGDIVQVRGGTYYQKFVPLYSGISGNYITYMSYTGETATIDGSGVSLSTSGEGEGLIQIAGKSYIRIQGFTIRDSSHNGINILSGSSGRSDHIEILGNTIMNSSHVGIFVHRSDNILIRDNTIYHVDFSSGIGIWWSNYVTVDNNVVDTPHWYHECQGAHEEGLTISGVNHFEVKNNTLDYTEPVPSGYCTNAQRLGITIKEYSQDGRVHHNEVRNFDAGSIHTDGWNAGENGTPTLNHVYIYQNYVHDSGGINVSCEYTLGTSEYVYIYNNLIVRAIWNGISVRGNWGNCLRKNIYIFNNTIYQASPSGGHGGAGIYVYTEHLGSNTSERPIIIRNNIVNFDFPNGGAYVGQIRAHTQTAASMISADHNIVYGPLNCPNDNPNCVEVGTRTTVNPTSLYVTPGSNFHLKSGSPAINTGATISLVTDDYDGVVRPQGSSFDIGAYEYGASITLTPTPSTTPTPTPTTARKPGDANGDGRVDGVDYVIWLNHYGEQTTAGYSGGDFNLDGRVDGIDYVIWLNNYGK